MPADPASAVAPAGAGRSPHARRSLPSFPPGALLPLAALVVLEIAVRADVVPGRLFPAPSQIAATLFDLARRDLWLHVAASTARVTVGFAIGAALAIAIGIVVGLSRRAEAFLDPSFQALRAIPGLAWVPLLLLWLGIDETPKVTLIAIGAFFPVYLNVVAGIHDVDRKLVEVGEMHGLKSRELVRRILLPAAMPSIFTGLRTGLSLAWMFMVAAELIAATRGIGYLLTDGRETSRPDIVLAAIILLAALGKLSDSLLKAAEERVLAWRDVLASRPG